MFIVIIILAVVFGGAAVFGQLGHYAGPGHFMIEWLVIGPKERPNLSMPWPAEYPENYDTFKQIGIRIQNIPYQGRLKRWVHQKTEGIVVVSYEVIDENGTVLMRGQGHWDFGWSESIPPTGPYESGIRQLNLFQKHGGTDIAQATWKPRKGTGDIGLGNYQLNLDVYNTEEQATSYIADLVVTKELQGFKIENIRLHNE